MEKFIVESKNSDARIKFELYEKGLVIANLTERDSLNSDEIASLSDTVMKLMKEIEDLKNDMSKKYCKYVIAYCCLVLLLPA